MFLVLNWDYIVITCCYSLVFFMRSAWRTQRGHFEYKKQVMFAPLWQCFECCLLLCTLSSFTHMHYQVCGTFQINDWVQNSLSSGTCIFLLQNVLYLYFNQWIVLISSLGFLYFLLSSESFMSSVHVYPGILSLK